MKKRTIGFILTGSKRGREYQEEKIFKNLAKERGINFVSFNLDEEINEAEIEKKSRQCSLVFNNTADEMAVELVKTIEFLGTKVIDSSKVFYYTEDKWMFFLKCQKHHLSVPKTILLSGNFHSAKKEMDNFGSRPLVLKRVQGERGDFVSRANNSREGIEIIKTFWKKGNEKLPVIAQEFIDSPCYRVTLVGDKIVQTAVKLGRGWKKTGAYAEDFDRFKVVQN